MLKQAFLAIRTFVVYACYYRCCFAPLGTAASAIAACYIIGARFCHIAAGHVGFDLIVAIAAVVVHLSLHETQKRLRIHARRKS